HAAGREPRKAKTQQSQNRQDHGDRSLNRPALGLVQLSAMRVAPATGRQRATRKETSSFA
ncbi:hypothetical protein, partial [Roseateles oligotrophus]